MFVNCTLPGIINPRGEVALNVKYVNIPLKHVSNIIYIINYDTCIIVTEVI